MTASSVCSHDGGTLNVIQRKPVSGKKMIGVQTIAQPNSTKIACMCIFLQVKLLYRYRKKEELR